MLNVRFHTPGQSAASSEPGPFFRIVGAVLCRGPRNEPVATWLKHWTVRDGEFARAEWSDAVMVYFEDNAGRASSAFGPFESFYVADGTARAVARTIARFDDQTQLWHPSGAQDGWVSLLVIPREMARLDLVPPAVDGPEREAPAR
jgi:hypothetical protein